MSAFVVSHGITALTYAGTRRHRAGLCASAASSVAAKVDHVPPSDCAAQALEHLKRAAAVGMVALSLFVATAQGAHAVENYDHNQGLADSNFSKRNLEGAVFTKANAERSDFNGANLSKANLENADFQECDFQGANLSFVLATKTKFQRANLKDANFTNANLMGAVFDRGTNITGADFTDALIDPFMAKKLCTIADGTNSVTKVDTRESLMCE